MSLLVSPGNCAYPNLWQRLLTPVVFRKHSILHSNSLVLMCNSLFRAVSRTLRVRIWTVKVGADDNYGALSSILSAFIITRRGCRSPPLFEMSDYRIKIASRLSRALKTSRGVWTTFKIVSFFFFLSSVCAMVVRYPLIHTKLFCSLCPNFNF